MEVGSLYITLQDKEALRPGDESPSVRVPETKADLYPQLVAMQRSMDAGSFALLSARAETQIAPGALSILIESQAGMEDSLAPHFLELHGAHALAHLKSSPLPLLFAGSRVWQATASSATAPAGKPAGLSGIAFPVQLGAMGNGYTVFFGARPGIGPDQLIDLHRKSCSVMRKALKLEINALAALESLNEREIECLQMVGNGMKSEAIGKYLNLSVHTVNAYLGSATTKLDAVNRIQAIAKAIRLGLIS